MEVLSGLLALTYTLTRLWPRTRIIRASAVQQEPQQISYYPKWPESALSGKRKLSSVLESFSALAASVPIDAASEEDREWRAWLDGGFEAHKFIHKSISRQSYADVLNCLHIVLTRCQQSYPDLWAVLKFVPKKNGLNPALSLLAKEGTDAVSVASLTPRVLRRRLDDLQRTFEQSWVLISCYLSQPPSVREDLLWAARTVTEKVKTDQRSRALELLCLGFFGRGAALFPLIVSTHAMDRCDFFEGCDPLPAPALCYEAYDDEACVYAYHDEAEAKAAWLNRLQSVREVGSVRLFGGPAVVDPDATRDAAPMAISLDESDNGIRWLRESFTCQYSGDDPHAMLSLGKRGWERSRLSFPYLEIAQRTWRNSQPMRDYYYQQHDASTASSIGGLLFRITRAAPNDKVLNSLVYWLLDQTYKEMSIGLNFPRWAPEPYLLRVPGVEARMVSELTRLGHLLDLLARAPSLEKPDAPLDGMELLRVVREVETTVTLLSTIRTSCEERQAAAAGSSDAASEDVPRVVERYTKLIASPTLEIRDLQTLQYEALAELLDLDYPFVASRHAYIAKAFAEWSHPELLFRYLNDNRNDPQMAPLIKRWLRSIFGLSDETLRQIRRESPQNVNHLKMLPKEVLLRWYSEGCPGTSSMKVLFMLGEDAGSCLRIISNDGNKYNKALMGYVLQSHVRALVVRSDGPDGGRILARSLVRLVLRSDTLTPIIFCDPIFFSKQYSKGVHSRLLEQAKELERYVGVPVVHAGSVLPVLEPDQRRQAWAQRSGRPSITSLARYTHVRRVTKLDYDMTFVDLVEFDGIAPYSYSEELPYDDMLDQHTAGVQERTEDSPIVVVAALPRADSPSADRYVAERQGETAWTMELDDDALPEEVVAQLQSSDHVSHTFNPATARARDMCAAELEVGEEEAD